MTPVRTTRSKPGSLLTPLATRVWHHRQDDVRGEPRRAPDALPGDLEVGVLRLEDVRHILLRVAVDQWEPGALHLHHDLVPLAETVVVAVQVDGVLRHLTG